MTSELSPKLTATLAWESAVTKVCRKLWKLRAETLRPALPWAAWRAIPAATPARSMMRLKAMLAAAPERCANEGNSRASSLAPDRVLEQESFDFGVHRQGNLLPEPRGFPGREGDRLRLQIDVAPSQVHRIHEPNPANAANR